MWRSLLHRVITTSWLAAPPKIEAVLSSSPSLPDYYSHQYKEIKNKTGRVDDEQLSDEDDASGGGTGRKIPQSCLL